MADLDLAMDPYDRKVFKILMGLEMFFLKHFYYVNDFYVYLFYIQEFHIRAQLMTDNICRKRGPTRLYCGFWVKSVVSIAMTNYFRRSFLCTSWILLSSVVSFAQSLSRTTYCPQSKNQLSFRRYKWTWTFFLVAIYCLF